MYADFYAEKRAAFQKTEEALAESVRLACSLLEPDNFADPPYLYLITELSKDPLSASFLGSHLIVEAYLNASSGLLVIRPRGGIKKGRPGTFPEQPLIFFYFWPVVLPKASVSDLHRVVIHGNAVFYKNSLHKASAFLDADYFSFLGIVGQLREDMALVIANENRRCRMMPTVCSSCRRNLKPRPLLG